MQQINAYSGLHSINRTQSNTENMQGGGNKQLGVNDFMKLLSTQLANQDVMNPVQDTEFIAQMAQFTSLQAMQTVSEIVYAQYGASMVGKNVVVASYDSTGKYVQDQGAVECVKFSNGDCLISVNGKDYTMSSVMEVLNKPKATEPPEDKPKENA